VQKVESEPVKDLSQELQQKLIEQQEDLKNRIKDKNNALKELINSTKSKLKSESINPLSSKHKEREEKLAPIFENLPTNPEEFIKSLENIKKDLSKKLTLEEINKLYQTQIELTKLQTELENLQNQQAQILQPTNFPPNNN